MENKRYWLATDLDGTFVGDSDALGKLLYFFEEAAYEVALVYVTGRHLASAQLLMEEERLPIPDLLITDVGTSIYQSDGQEDADWRASMLQDWQPDEIAEIAASFSTLKRQQLPDDRRVSFTVTKDLGEVDKFRKALNSHGLPHSFIFSSNRDIDVLPGSAGKGKALEYALDQYAADDIQLLIAGDSGNDMDMLSLGHPSVIVGNAQPELLNMKPCENLFFANEHCAGGIHEAWLHFYGDQHKLIV